MNKNKPVVTMITLFVTVIIILTINNLLFAAELNADSSAPFLTHNDTIYGISIEYPSSWEIGKSASEDLLSFLQNISNSESELLNNEQNNTISSKVSNILEVFGLEKISDVLGLNSNIRLEILQKISQSLNEGGSGIIVQIVSPSEDESDTFVENVNIVARNISTISPVSLSDYANSSIEGLKAFFPTFAMIEPSKEIVVDGNPAISFIYTVKTDEYQEVKDLQVITIRDEMVYTFTFTASPETYSMYEPTFERILQSFKIHD